MLKNTIFWIFWNSSHYISKPTVHVGYLMGTSKAMSQRKLVCRFPLFPVYPVTVNDTGIHSSSLIPLSPISIAIHQHISHLYALFGISYHPFIMPQSVTNLCPLVYFTRVPWTLSFHFYSSTWPQGLSFFKRINYITLLILLKTFWRLSITVRQNSIHIVKIYELLKVIWALLSLPPPLLLLFLLLLHSRHHSLPSSKTG